MDKNLRPGLFGQKHSSRDYTKAASWGKNIFNSTFPASLLAYMYSKDIAPVYLCVDAKNILKHKYLSSKEIFRIDPLSDDAFYNYEAGFSSFEQYYTGDREKIDLVMLNRQTGEALIGLEIKLTALPDSTTKLNEERDYSCELVVRPPTICFLARSICELFKTDKEKTVLRKILNTVPKIIHWGEVSEVEPHYKSIQEAITEVAKLLYKRQSPLIVQPIWKMKGNKLAYDCLDVFVWSNLAVLQMCYTEKSETQREITRFQRTIIWIFLMLKDFVDYDKFDYTRIIRDHSYGNANDKAFAISKEYTPFLKSPEQQHPRISRDEIKNIILGGGQNLLSPERRFDAVIVNSPDLFCE